MSGGTNGGFASATNWTYIANGTAAVAQAAPGILDTVGFTSGGGPIAASATVAALQFGGPAQFQIGAASTLTATGTAGVTVGASGSGALALTAGATIISKGATDIVSGTSRGAANVTINGTGASWSSAGKLIVGGAGLGSFDIQSGASVSAASAVIANTGSASGAAVNVAGGAFKVTGTLTVGNAGFGQLAISQGASVSAVSIDLGALAGGSGALMLAGSNLGLTTSGNVTVGDKGAGEFSILNGATVTIGGDLNIGRSLGGSGNVDIEDPSGTVIVDGNLNLGADGVLAPAVLTLGLNTHMKIVGGINISGNAVTNFYSQPDPQFLNNLGSRTQTEAGNIIYFAYVRNDGVGGLEILQDQTWSVDTPTFYGLTGGKVKVDTNAAMILNADTVTNQTISFLGSTGKLTDGIDLQPTISTPPSGTVTANFTTVTNPNYGLPSIGGFQGVIAGFTAGDVITVDTTAAATFSQSGSIVSVLSNNGTIGHLTFDTAAAAASAFSTPGALVDTVVPVRPPCFAAGTLIETVDGPAAVETLTAGDQVRTLLGGSGRIIWVGTRTVDCARHPDQASVWPVRIRKDTFGQGMPARDVFVSPDHAIYVDGVLVPAKCLINGGSIRQVKLRRVSYHHIELAQHDVVLADGLPAETYLDTGDRARFTGGSIVALYPDFAARTWEAKSCAPLLQTGPLLETVRACLERGNGHIKAVTVTRPNSRVTKGHLVSVSR